MLPNLERSLRLVKPEFLETLDGLSAGHLHWPLFVFGPTGSGKTCAALALADVCETACYWSADGLADFTMSHEPSETQAEFDYIGGKALAILDELGARERVGDLAYSTVKRFADAREQQAGRVAVYLSNVTPSRLAELYDDRIAGRLLCGTVVELSGNDRRRAIR